MKAFITIKAGLGVWAALLKVVDGGVVVAEHLRVFPTYAAAVAWRGRVQKDLDNPRVKAAFDALVSENEARP